MKDKTHNLALQMFHIHGSSDRANTGIHLSFCFFFSRDCELCSSSLTAHQNHVREGSRTV